MLYQKQFGAFIVLLVLGMALAKSKFLEEKHPSLPTCKKSDPNFNTCYGKFFATSLRVYKDDFPGAKTSVDPLHIKGVGIVQNDNNPIVQLNLNMKDIELYGMSGVLVKDVNFDLNKLDSVLDLVLPKIELKFDYQIKAKFLQIPIDGSGKGNLIIDTISILLQLHHKLRDEFDHTFTDVEKVQLKIKDIKGLHIYLYNLFNGQKELEQSTNEFINQNWRDIYAVLKPAIEESVETVLRGIIKKFFHFIPATYIIEDIPTAKEFYG